LSRRIKQLVSEIITLCILYISVKVRGRIIEN
jgi:hypothetical protein